MHSLLFYETHFVPLYSHCKDQKTSFLGGQKASFETSTPPPHPLNVFRRYRKMFNENISKQKQQSENKHVLGIALFTPSNHLPVLLLASNLQAFAGEIYHIHV